MYLRARVCVCKTESKYRRIVLIEFDKGAVYGDDKYVYYFLRNCIAGTHG